jgi:NADH-quinone oxidoreductase subunit M
MTLLLGVYPSLVTDVTGPSVAALITDYQAALPVADATQLASQ